MSKSVGEIVWEEVDSAHARYEASGLVFWQVAKVVGRSGSDEDLEWFAEALGARTAAMNAYTNALKRYTEFLANGTAPNDLSQSARPPVAN